MESLVLEPLEGVVAAPWAVALSPRSAKRIGSAVTALSRCHCNAHETLVAQYAGNNKTIAASGSGLGSPRMKAFHLLLGTACIASLGMAQAAETSPSPPSTTRT